jgi:hypothetical protein
VRQFLAWKSIDEERETLNLDAFQANQTRTRKTQADETVNRRIPEAHQWLLVPSSRRRERPARRGECTIPPPLPPAAMGQLEHLCQRCYHLGSLQPTPRRRVNHD